jgi:hypothetical protein
MMRGLLGALAIVSAAAPAVVHAQHAGDMIIGSTADGGGALSVEYDFTGVVPVGFDSEPVPGTSLYVATDPGFDALEADEVAESFYVLDGGTPVSVQITALEPGKTAMFLNGTLLDAVGESVVLGTQGGTPPNDLHHHPQLQLILALPAGEFGEGSISFKLTTTSGSYAESASYTMTLSNGHLAPIEYDTADYDGDSVNCQKTIGKEARKLMSKKYQVLSKCLDKIQVLEAREHAGLDTTSAAANALAACGDDLVGAIGEAETKANAKAGGKCGASGSQDYGVETIAAHLNFIGCRAEEMVSASYRGAQGLLAEFTALGQPLDSFFPCLVPAGPHAHDE